MSCFDDIKSAAEDMFGADNVDLQNLLTSRPYLVIHWDEIEVSNEYDEKHIIYDLYTRIIFTDDAKMVSFDMTRTTLTSDEMNCGYVFSHLPRQRASVMSYTNPCLGGGPIRSTMTTLAAGYNSDIFRLFLVELDRYVRTESVSGGPYIRIREIGSRYSVKYNLCGINMNTIPDSYIINLYDYIMMTNPIKPVYHDRKTIDFGLSIPFVCRITKDTVDYLRHKEHYCDADINLYLIKGSFYDGDINICSAEAPFLSEPITTEVYFKGGNVGFKKIVNESVEDTYVARPEVVKGIVVMLYRDYFTGKIKYD